MLRSLLRRHTCEENTPRPETQKQKPTNKETSPAEFEGTFLKYVQTYRLREYSKRGVSSQRQLERKVSQGSVEDLLSWTSGGEQGADANRIADDIHVAMMAAVKKWRG
jgi:hypothetical protein